MEEKPNKYHVTDAGDIFRINDDGSFTSIGNAEKMSESKHEEEPVSEQEPLPSSKVKSTPPPAKRNSRKRFWVYGVLYIIAVLAVIVWYNSFYPLEREPADEQPLQQEQPLVMATDTAVILSPITTAMEDDAVYPEAAQAEEVPIETAPQEDDMQVVPEQAPIEGQSAKTAMGGTLREEQPDAAAATTESHYDAGTVSGSVSYVESQRLNTIDPNKVYYSVEVQAEFPGGDRARRQWLHDNIVWPRDNNGSQMQGDVELEFIIERDGSVSNVKVSYSDNPGLNPEAIRLISSMPKWSPAMVRNQPVRSPMGITLFF